MTYKLAFDERALKEWKKLDSTIREQFKTKLRKILDGNPRIPANQLHGVPDCYKIKLRTSGYRLAYQVQDEIVTVKVIAVGHRDKSEAYRKMQDRL